MKNQTYLSPIKNVLIPLACAACLSIPATAQMNGGGMQQTPPVGQQQQQPGMVPGGIPGNTDDSPGQIMDKAFVRKALEGGMVEVQLGQLALQKSNNADVKQFAQQMIDDHTKLGDAMKQVAQQMSVPAPASPSKKDKATIAKLQALNGDDFDKAYIKDMVQDHQQDAKEFKSEAQNTANPGLKQLTTQGAQMIDDHLQMIEQIAQKNNIVAMR